MTRKTAVDIFNEVFQELNRATQNFDNYHSSHEGYAVLKEEVDKLWDAIKDKKCGIPDQRKEAIQIATVAIRFIRDLCDLKYQ